jgi:maltodextrin utilization protein YvdJ
LNILQKHHFHDLFSFEYCVGMVAMAMGVPAIVAIIVGIAFPTTAVMLPILWVGTIAMLYWSYRQTGFKRNTMI